MNNTGAGHSRVSEDIARAVAAFNNNELTHCKLLQPANLERAEAACMTSWGPQMKR